MIVDQTTISLLLPEIILVAIATFIYVAGTFNPHPRWWATFSVITYLAVLSVLRFADNVVWLNFSAGHLANSGPLAVDYLGQALRAVAVLMGLLFTLMNWPTANAKLTSERLGTLMLVVVGVMLVSRANELVLLFLGLELVSIPTYVLLFLGRRDRASAEATAKYFFLSILSSGVLLYGFSFLYGLGGSTSLAVIRQTLLNPATGASAVAANLAPVAVVLIVAGLGFKIAAVPFHFYAPDVYQGTTNANAGLLAVAPKIAGIVALLRIVAIAMPSAATFAWQLVIVLAIVTMTLGNICALWQKNLRRLLAYSSIAHAGYLLIGLAVGVASQGSGTGYSGLAAMLLYLVVYAFASMGMFGALTYLGTDERPVNDVDELAGLGQRSPVTALAIAVCMFSFAGIPVFAGFWGKYALFVSALGLATGAGDGVSLWFTVLAVVGAINAAIGAAYYLRVIAMMFFHSPRSAAALPDNLAPRAAMLLASAVVVLIGVLPGVPFQQARQAAESVQPARGVNRAEIVPAPDATQLTAKP